MILVDSSLMRCGMRKPAQNPTMKDLSKNWDFKCWYEDQGFLPDYMPLLVVNAYDCLPMLQSKEMYISKRG